MTGYGNITEGTSQVQLTPEEDVEMRKMSEVFDKARNAVIDASRLAKEVAALREDVASIRAEMESLRERNNTLDEALVATRRQRDEAQAKVGELITDKLQLEHGLAEITADRDFWRSKYESLDITYGVLKDESLSIKGMLETSNKERDELKAKLELIESVLHPTASEYHPPQTDDPNLPKADPWA